MMKIIVFILNAAIQTAAAVAVGLLLLLGMNGYSERDATPGLYLYAALGLGSALGLGLASAFAAGWLVRKKSFGRVGASATAVLSFAVLGGVILAVSFFAAIALAEIVRGMR